MSNGPVEGDTAPAFDMPADGGGQAKLGDFSGKSLVLYFYPRDDTPGCTKEAIAFTEMGDAFETAGTAIVGVSRDTVAKHEKFKTKHDLNVVLGSDADGSVCEAYGVWVEKNMYGKKSMGIERATFLIGPDGTVRKVWRKVKVAGHVEAVLEAAQAL
jgi:peroxiredoxin Q/BCP